MLHSYDQKPLADRQHDNFSILVWKTLGINIVEKFFYSKTYFTFSPVRIVPSVSSNQEAFSYSIWKARCLFKYSSLDIGDL